MREILLSKLSYPRDLRTRKKYIAEPDKRQCWGVMESGRPHTGKQRKDSQQKAQAVKYPGEAD